MDFYDIVDLLLGPIPSEEYANAMLIATEAMQEIGPKIKASTPITPEEGMRVLNANWAVYLLAVEEEDMSGAKNVAKVVTLLSEYLKYCGFVVKFTDKYYVEESSDHRGPEGLKGAKHE
jgi:hypothetical protein